MHLIPGSVKQTAKECELVYLSGLCNIISYEKLEFYHIYLFIVTFLPFHLHYMLLIYYCDLVTLNVAEELQKKQAGNTFGD